MIYFNKSDEEMSEEKCELESHHMRTIFPEEIWLLLLGRVKNPVDYQNVIMSSLFFRSLIQTKLPERLFPDVWPILQNTLESYENHSCQGRNTAWSQSILQLRSVSKSWNAQITKYIQSLGKQVDPADFPENRKWAHIKFCQFNAPNQPSNFLQTFENSIENPFVGRGIVIQCQDTASEFLTNLLKVLERYGSELLYCTLYMYQTEHFIGCWYLRLRELLIRMKNLKSLELHYLPSTPLGYECMPFFSLAQYGGFVLQSGQYNIRQYLDNLEFLKCYRVAHSCIHMLLRHSDNVKLVQIELDRTTNHFIVYQGRASTFPIFEKLHIRIRDPIVMQYLKDFESNFRVNIIILDFQECPFIQWEEIITCISVFWEELSLRGALRSLSLKLPKATNMEDQEKILFDSIYRKLFCLNVEDFTLTASNVHALNFLLPFKDTLENLVVNSKIWTPGIFKEDAEVFGIFVQNQSEMMHSKMWNLFPRLQSIKFCENSDPSESSSTQSTTWCVTRKEYCNAKQSSN